MATSYTALASVEEVTRRLEDEPTERMLVMIAEYLEDVSDQAREYGRRDWDASSAPAPVKRIVADCVARFMRNPDAFNQSRAADETVGWVEAPKRPTLDDDEIARIKRHSGVVLSGFGSHETYAYSSREQPDVIHVPWGNQINKPFPLIAINDPLGAYEAW